MAPPDHSEGLNEPSGEPIVLKGLDTVIFEVDSRDIASQQQDSSKVETFCQE